MKNAHQQRMKKDQPLVTRHCLGTLASAIVLSVLLTSCGGSSSQSQDSLSESGDTSSSTLSASDITAQVNCGPWTQGTFMEADCDIVVENKSSASGNIYVSWNWQNASGRKCMMGFSRDLNGDPINIAIEPNQRGTLSTRQQHSCSPSDAVEAANLKITVKD